MATADTIDFELPCACCGYNLETLPSDGECPECGESVSAAIAAESRRPIRYPRLRARGVPWMRAIREGLAFGGSAWLLTMFLVLTRRRPADAFDLAVPTMAIILWIGLAWRLFTSARRGVRWIGRGTVVAALVTFIASGLNDRWATYYFGRIGPLPWPVDDRFFEVAARLATCAPYVAYLAAVMTVCRLVFCAWIAGHQRIAVGLTAVAAPPAIRLLLALSSFDLPPMMGIPRAFAEVCLIALAFGLPIVLTILAYTLTRAIRLGELPEASSHSSPAPRPPA